MAGSRFSYVHHVCKSYRNSDTSDVFERARKDLMSRYATHGMQQSIVHTCLALDPSLFRRRLQRTGRSRWFALVLSYHPLFDALKLNRVLQDALSLYSYELNNLFDAEVGFRLAWRNDSGNLFLKLIAIYRCGKQQPLKGGW